MNDILFLEPIFKETVWGGKRLETEFSYEIPSDHTGECWGIAAHEHGDCRIKNGVYKGWTLSALWREHRELFGNLKEKKFPLLIKILDAKEDLSIQVHPDDWYVRERENSFYGKTECWYVLDCETDGDIVIGHNAKTREELYNFMKNGEWDKLLRRVPIKKGDFFQINPGCVHAIRKGTLILETQQNSDITYRMYDYDRLQNGKPRELHTKECLEVVTVPHKDVAVQRELMEILGIKRMHLITCDYYSVEHWTIDGKGVFLRDKPFFNISLIEGAGTMNDSRVKKGDHLIITAGEEKIICDGEWKAVVSWWEKDDRQEN